MTERQLAALWWRQLFSELGTAADTATPGPLGLLARERHWAVEQLFFTLLLELPVDCLIEVGAHDAEVSKRFVGAKHNARAVAYEPAPEIYRRVAGQGLPERLTMHNCAVGAKSGSVKFFVPRDPLLHPLASVRKHVGNIDAQEIEAPMVTLDEADRGLRRTGDGRDLGLWIDVEGTALDVLRGGERLLGQRVSVVYVEVNDISVYEGAATSLEIISLLLRHGFIPVARDNQHGDAWNLLAAHEDAHFAARETIARWIYQFSGSAASAKLLAKASLLTDLSALKFQTIFEAASGRSLSLNENAIPVLLAAPDGRAQIAIISSRYGSKGALVSPPGLRVCRADPTGTLVADRQHVMAHEIFDLVPATGSEFHMKSHFGSFVRLNPNGTFDAAARSVETAARFGVKESQLDPAEIQNVLHLPTLGNLLSQ